jgi:hypothetical protein
MVQVTLGVGAAFSVISSAARQRRTSKPSVDATDGGRWIACLSRPVTYAGRAANDQAEQLEFGASGDESQLNQAISHSAE